MSDFVKNYNTLQQIERGNFDEIKKYGEGLVQKIQGGQVTSANLFELVDIAGRNEAWLKAFSESFSTEMYGNRNHLSFKKLNQDEIEKINYAVTGTATSGGGNPVAPQSIGTSILPTIEGLIMNTDLLADVSIQEVGTDNKYKQLYDFDDGSLETANVLAETAAGTDSDVLQRKGDLLIPDKKTQRSMQISRLALTSFDPYELAIFMARLPRSVAYKMIGQMFYDSGTGAKGNTWRGIKNGYGITATNGDASGAIGAISYATRAATDTAITTAGGVTSTDIYDLCVKVKRLLLPRWLSLTEEDKYAYVMNRNTWGKISTVLDANGRYKSQSAIDPTTGKAIKQIDDTPVKIWPGIVDNEVFLVPLTWYVIVTNGGFLNLNDGGVLQIREDLVTYVSRFYGDASMRYGFKYRKATNVTFGTTPFDNQDQNAWRSFFIV